MMRFSIFVCALAVIISLSSGSAIPMWEFLSRGEKMTYLFNMFVKQVQKRCDLGPMPDCNKVLMVYGLTNLAKMDDDSLDKMDPYQRGAHDIIWDSMMKGGVQSESGSSPSSRTDPEDYYASGRDRLESDVQEGSNSVGAQAASTVTDEELVPPPVSVSQPQRFVIGPMVVRVLPDGSPVPGDADRPLPRDEDAEEIRVMRTNPMSSIERQHQLTPEQRAQVESRMRLMLSSQPQERYYTDSGAPSARFQGVPPSQQSRINYQSASQSQPLASYALPPPGVNRRVTSQ